MAQTLVEVLQDWLTVALLALFVVTAMVALIRQLLGRRKKGQELPDQGEKTLKQSQKPQDERQRALDEGMLSSMGAILRILIGKQ